MQEEPGETVSSGSNGVSMWLCPLCQQGQPDRDGLSLHLTGKHSVLPACLDKLLDIAVQTHSSSEDAEGSVQRETADACSEPTQDEGDSRKTQQIADSGQMRSGDKETATLEKETVDEVEGMQDPEGDVGVLESDQESAAQSSKAPGGSVSNDKSTGKNEAGTESKSNRPFKCNACLESFATKTALSVHYNSATHIQRMRTGSSKQAGENDASGQYPPRPYVSNKPYQCAVCRVSYNHAITLESHLKSVLHQTRSRNASTSANKTPSSSSNSSSMVPSLVVTTTGNAAQLVNTTTSNCITQPSLTASAATTKDGEQIQPAPSLLTAPVASAQAVSAFLTLLTSSPNSIPHSILPSLFATGAGTTPGTAGPQLIPQAQVLMPLILNGLQTQNQSSNPDSPSQLMPQSLPLLGLTAAQQALLAQRLGGLQSQWSSVGLQGTAQPDTEDSEKGAEKTSGLQRPCEETKSEPKPELLPIKLDIKSVVKSGGLKKEIKEEEQGKMFAREQSCALKTEENRVEDDIEHMDKGQEDDTDEESTMERESAESDTKKLPCTNVTNSLAAPGQSLLGDGTSSDPDQAQCFTPKHRQTVNSTELKTRPAKASPLNASLALGRSGLGGSRPRPPFSPGAPVLSEFQYQVLLAFLESRSEADAASPPREDCEALGREVGLTEEEVRKWLEDAHQAKERQKAGEHGRVDEKDEDQDDDDEESALTIDESPVRTAVHAIDLSSGGDRRREKERESQGDPCLTSDSENEEVYTSVIVTDEESQSSSMREEPSSPAKEVPQREQAGEKTSCGGKVLRSTTVFLSDAEEDEDEEEGGAHMGKRKKRKREPDGEDVEAKRDRPDPDLDLELEAQADPPTPLSVAIDQRGLPSGILHSLPLSLSLAPFSTQFISPYVLSLPSSVVGVGVAEGDGGKVAAFPNAQTIAHCSATFSDPLNPPGLSSHSHHTHYMSNGGDCETALDLSMGKNHGSTKASTSVSVADMTAAQKGRLLDGLGLRPAAVGVPSEGGLIVLQVKPDSAIAIPASNNSNFINHNNLAKTNAVLMRAAERDHTSTTDREKEKEREKEQRRPKARRFKDMRRSRTIIQAEQLDVLYGCYFKDPNPGKHEFEQISEWVHLPKKVVQIWFQNMRARERKGEVRFISDGTLAAVGKPLIKFTWPLTQPIFSSSPKNSTHSISSTGATTVNIHPKPTPGKEEKVAMSLGTSRQKEAASASAVASSGGSVVVPKPKPDPPTTTPVTMVKIAPKANHPIIQVSAMDTTPTSFSPSPKPNPEEEHDNPEQDEETDQDSPGPGATNRMVSKSSTSPASTGPEKATGESQQHNGINYWSPKSPFKINTLSREQLGLASLCTRNLTPTTARNPTPTPSPRNPTATTPPRNPPSTTARIPTSTTAVVTTTSTSTPTPTVAKSSQRDVGFLTHSTPRRPRTHLTCLQLSILQSCYETCAHPNALECEAVGTELGLPLKVVQIWFQNTRAKEKRWRLQQEKLSPSSDPSKKVEISAASYLQYNALRANRPILPKPVQLTVVEPSQPPGVGQPAGRETLRGRCEACNASFESRAAARAHVFSPRHLATLRTTNFGQPAALLNNGSGTGAGSNSSVTAVSSTPSPASSTTS
ncbi:zinc finger homeobox protein 3 isoform X2 [Clupea harengus]|uniref:Zinc finger homeobox protein 3 isoform X2 n=1 Tax=Clupea harengus TaxID=7950 RepID=A0A8M1KGS8_CLUHA|nr:zinc finger homeobox protein 3 isoform X2 [Clupea harengus]